MTLLFSAPALRDLDYLFTAIAEDSPARAARFILRIRARCEILETFPMSGRARPEFGPGVRSFPVWPVIVFFRVDGEFAIVARVIDGRRDLGTAFFADQLVVGCDCRRIPSRAIRAAQRRLSKIA